MAPKIKKQICKVCRYENKPRKKGFSIFQQKLQRSVSGGCEVCTLILRGILACFPLLYSNRSTMGKAGNCFFWSRDGMLIQSPYEGESKIFELYVLPGSFNPFPRILRTASHIPGDTASISSVFQVQRWLQRCNATHIKCGSIDIDVPLPTRLVEVAPRLRLVETKGMHDRYACLSHCWGSQESTTAQRTVKTTRENLNSSLENIKFTSLPRTFRDAVMFTRKLGLKYLWIDSLCIIQDDEDDWRHEASLMANIYENAVLTIGATASASDSEGLFRSCSSFHDPIELRGTTSKGKGYIAYARRQLTHGTWKEPLYKRAWIFQERFLAPRFLHFASNELIWECKQGMECECNEKTLLGATDGFSNLYRNNSKSSYLKAFTATPNGVHVIWRDVVHAYTALKLSHAKDKLPAISGIAKKFIGLRPKDRYVAGLWESSFVPDLLWCTAFWEVSEKGLRPRPKKWRAPTWSWASVDSAVATKGVWYTPYYGYDDEPRLTTCIDIITINSVPAGDDNTGELSSGYAVLRGCIMAGYFKSGPCRYGLHYITKESYEWQFYPDYEFNVDDESGVQDGDQLFCLRIAANSPRKKHISDEFLILRAKRGMIRTFERVGLMMLYVGRNDFYQLFELQREECTIMII